MAPAGTRPAAMPVLAGSSPATTQWTKLSAARSTNEMASSWVFAGTPSHEMAGDVSAPLHVNWASMNPPSAQGAVTVKPVGRAVAVVVGAAVVVVMIDRVWFGLAGRSVRPSL